MAGDYFGLTTHSISNNHIRLEYLTEAGPRLVRLFIANSPENQLAELPKLTTETPYGDYYFRGGHRLWHAPEDMPRTYIVDNEQIQVEKLSNSVCLTQPTETQTGIQKSIEIKLHNSRPALTLTHTLTNNSLWPVELAPWAITQLPLGGTAILPQLTTPLDKSGLLPNRQLNLWPYTQWQDSRLKLNDAYTLLIGRADNPPCKIGYFNHHGWAGYLRSGIFFCKRFDVKETLPHPDFNSNVEVYCNHQFLELETLGPLCLLQPGQTTTHVEQWDFYTEVDMPTTVDGVQTLVDKLKLKK